MEEIEKQKLMIQKMENHLKSCFLKLMIKIYKSLKS